MGTPETLDFDRILMPIPGENPAGRPLRMDFSPTAIYRSIKDARSEARAGERSAAWGEDQETQTVDPRIAWKRLMELAPEAIAEESKDIEVAAWLTEGLVREHGYAGLRDGFRLMSQLAELFWDTLYPLPDEDGLTTRLAPVAGLNGEESDGVLIAPIINIPITAAESCRPLSLADYRRAVDLDQLADPEKRTQRIEHGTVTLQVFEKAVRETSREFYNHLQEDMRECSEAFEKLCAVLEEKCGTDASGYPLAPPSSAIRSALEICRDEVHGIVGRILGIRGDMESIQNGGEMTLVSGQGSLDGSASSVRTREEAFRALLQVAEYFKRTEPHSPVAYTLEQAVRWGRMPLPELLTELIPEPMTREQIFKMIGIKQPELPSS